MTKVTVELEWEAVEHIARSQIKEMKEDLEGYLIQIKNNKKGTVFDLDYKKDKKKIKQHIEACEMIYAYFGGHNK